MQANAITQFRILPTFAAGGAFTIAIFWLLYSVIHATGHGVDKSDLLPTIDFVRLKRDSQVETLERRRPPPPPPPEAPPPPAKMKIASTESTPQQSPTPFALPNLGLSASVGGGPFVGSMGGGGGPQSIGGMFDGDIIPLQRISPQYPREAARARITGWVQLEVMVNADGSVRSARVLEAQPKGLFEAAAVAAVLKWKFKPKVVNGQSVAQRGAQRIEFNLTQS